jgi:inositol-pentakisphosphate 2-kinase
MHSSMKHGQGEHVPLGYCPLDLFSGDRARMERAIDSLYDAWLRTDAKINNLKIFVRGEKISPANVGSPVNVLS